MAPGTAGVRRAARAPSARRKPMSSAASFASARNRITCTGSARPLRLNRSSIDVGDTLDLPGEMRDRRAGEDLRRAGDPAEPRREVQRPTPVPTLDGHGLARVEPDPTARGRVGSATVSSTNRRWSSTDARIACRGESKTASASSPRSSTRCRRGPRPFTRDRGELACERAAASSPFSWVKTV